MRIIEDYVPIYIQARLGSERLPRKILRKIKGKTLLEYVYERCAYEPNEWAGCPIVLFPEEDCRDPELVRLLQSDVDPDERDYDREIDHSYGGGASDVAGRFRQILEAQESDAFVRICADSPLIDPMLIDAAISLYNYSASAKLVSNPGYPHGQQVEVINTQWFLEWEPKMVTAGDREHVTLLLKDRAKTGEHVLFGPWKEEPEPWPKLTVDTPEDFARMERIIGRMTRPYTEYGWLECVRLAQQG